MSWPRAFACWLFIALMLFGSRQSAAQALWELSPYRIRLLTLVAPDAQLAGQLEADVQRGLLDRAASMVGAPWQLEVASAAEAVKFAVDDQLSLADEIVQSESADFDKLTLLALETAQHGGYLLRIREFDVFTQLWGPLLEQTVARRAELPAAAFRLLHGAFAPTARIESATRKTATIRIRGSFLPRQDEALSLLPAGNVLRPVLRARTRGNEPPRTMAVDWTYLVANDPSTSPVECALFSGLGNPLGGRRRGRTQQVALAVPQPQGNTQLTLQTRGESPRPLIGYDILSYPPGQERPELLARTNYQGQAVIPPGQHPLRMLLVRSGQEILARVPVVPGLQPEILAPLPDDSARLQAEGFITGYQESLVDLVAQREILLARIRYHLDEERYEDAQQLFDELQALPDRQEMVRRLRNGQGSVSSADARVKQKIDKLFQDTYQLVERCFTGEALEELEAELRSAPPRDQPAAE